MASAALDLTFGDVRVEQRSITSVRADGVDIRAVAPPQRIQADKLSLTVELTADDVASWLDHIAPDGVTVRIVDRRVLARLPGLAQFGRSSWSPGGRGERWGLRCGGRGSVAGGSGSRPVLAFVCESSSGFGLDVH